MTSRCSASAASSTRCSVRQRPGGSWRRCLRTASASTSPPSRSRGAKNSIRSSRGSSEAGSMTRRGADQCLVAERAPILHIDRSRPTLSADRQNPAGCSLQFGPSRPHRPRVQVEAPMLRAPLAPVRNTEPPQRRRNSASFALASSCRTELRRRPTPMMGCGVNDNGPFWGRCHAGLRKLSTAGVSPPATERIRSSAGSSGSRSDRGSGTGRRTSSQRHLKRTADPCRTGCAHPP